MMKSFALKKNKAFTVFMFCSIVQLLTARNIQSDNVIFALSGQEASVIGMVDSSSTEMIIPLYVEYADKVFDVTSINDRAFIGHNNLKKVSLPETIRRIGSLAFAFCDSLNQINITSTIDTICTDAFYNCFSLPVEDNIRYAGCFLVSISDNNAQELVIRDGCKWIGDNAISNCHELKKIIIPGSVKVIGNFAFSACDKLETIYIPDSVELISHSAFSACSSLKSIYLPEKTESYYFDLFIDCHNLNYIHINSKYPPIIIDDNNSHHPPINYFYRFNADSCRLVVPYGSKKHYKKAPGWNSFKKIVCKKHNKMTQCYACDLQ